MLEQLQCYFPHFFSLLQSEEAVVCGVLPAATEMDIGLIEGELGLPLPDSYRRFLLCTRGLQALGGRVNLGPEHPFFHDWPPHPLGPPKLLLSFGLERLWPPASQGMLCIADYFLEADGDAVLFDVSRGMKEGEYPVMYFAHDVGWVRKLADSFGDWLEGVGYDLLETEEADSTVWPPAPKRPVS